MQIKGESDEKQRIQMRAPLLNFKKSAEESYKEQDLEYRQDEKQITVQLGLCAKKIVKAKVIDDQ